VPVYVSRADTARHAPEAGPAVLAALGRVLGRTAALPELRCVRLGEVLTGPVVAEGRYASVHQGTQLTTARRAAVKVLRDGLGVLARESLRREAEWLAELEHPGIVRCLDAGEEDWSVSPNLGLQGTP
jgi:eukaryotic-like serine/threonine-protein kinase